MQNYLINVLNPGEAPEHNGQTIHALKLAAELRDGGAQVELVFAGQGVSWVPRFANRTEDSHPFVKNYGACFDSVRGLVKACNMCCKRFDATEAIALAGIPIVGEGSDHMNIGRYLLDGYQLINY